MFLKLKKFRNIFDISVYSEGKEYSSYFINLINKISQINPSVKIIYLTSDKNDRPKFINNINTLYIGKGSLRTIIFKIIKTKLFLLTMPELGNFYLQRSLFCKKYIYIFHSLASIHSVYKNKAFHNYDIFFFPTMYHVKEMMRYEKIHKLHKRIVVKYGYSRLDNILIQKKEDIKITVNKKNILVAPSWGKNSITNTVADQLIKVLLKKKYKVFFRPHPHSFKVDKKVTLQLIKNFQKEKDFYLIDNINEIHDFKKCSIMITDYSGVAFDFSFAFLKPLIFINLPPKINNEAYKLFKIKPIEHILRKKLGMIIEKNEIQNLHIKIQKLQNNKNLYIKSIKKLKSEMIFNIGKSDEYGAKYLISLLKKF